VLYLLGVLGVILLQAQSLSDYFKENVEITVILENDAKEGDIELLRQRIAQKKYTKDVQYISKDQAAQIFTQQNQENFQEILGYNPLFSSLNLYVRAQYSNSDSLQRIKSQIVKYDTVSEVFYQKSLVDLINVNTSKLSFILFIISLGLLLVAVALIDNTIKLAMYSNRFLIKSMQLVGATRWFIARPFIDQSVYNGVISGLIAALFLVVTLFLTQATLPELGVLHHPFSFVFLCAMVLLLGVFISWWSTKRSVIKYLQMRLDDLY